MFGFAEPSNGIMETGKHNVRQNGGKTCGDHALQRPSEKETDPGERERAIEEISASIKRAMAKKFLKGIAEVV